MFLVAAGLLYGWFLAFVVWLCVFHLSCTFVVSILHLICRFVVYTFGLFDCGFGVIDFM